MSQKVFEFKDLFLEVKNEDKNICTEYAKLLDGVSGKFVSGELTAVMGASGAGKSTLFNMLLGRISNDCKSYGTILYNGKERSAYDWVHQVAYLKQEDIFYTKFSILECILYNLDFYQPFTSKKEKLSVAEDLLRRSNIFEKRHAYMESLSGGERKRAMIALSMCSDPEIIFMDEPTSGLDSHSALTLINFMKTYAKENDKIVVISLHQPGEALFNLFDNILYLGKGGVFYDGKIKDIPDWLNANKIPKPEGISLAEFLFELHTDNPHPPEISRFRPNVDQIINSNRQKYDELRRSNVLVGNLSSRYFEMSMSLVDVITFIRRFYLNVHRTEKFFKSFAVHMLFILFFSCLFYFGALKEIVNTLLNVSFESDTLKDLVDHTKTYFTSDHEKIFFTFYLYNVFWCQLCLHVLLEKRL
ncbi:ATP-binding cassette sub-family G member 1 [Nosema bombycis CQ1]|uniref:ATP-binding cassette sub-family G member 1 n=1 Tax=Nosema bombycis (strain CQ1 / CVCC 102059) TaxID=578461 RepID=R0MLS9_NOSB1|nr:ATP-binding cassette sub-family G member 1 [Nosema bombycis CQ1]|eukprot:EOB15205.1 ATP-binding cassette sub-family G member 1 [Nosema bombycis CQ1]